jgi:hypothetical protein
MAGYTRQSTFADGDTITAALFNNEYNQLVNAFSNTTGHSHDGTAASGPVIGLIGDAGETSPNNKVLIDTTNNYIEFYVEVSSNPVQQLYIADGAIIPVTDSDIDLGTTSLRFKDTYTDTITTTGNVDIGGNLTVTGNATISGNLTFGDADTDSINLSAEIDSNIVPNTDDTYDLGTSTKQWRNLYIDGTAEIDTLALDGTTVTSTAAELNILDGVTSTATELNILDGVTATTVEINLLDGVTATTSELNILDGVTSTATELNIVDGNTAATSTTLADADRVVVNDNGTMVQVALTDFETYFEGALDTLSNVTTVGALNAGSITSGFGAIDNGSSAITTTGTVTYGSLSDGSITITAFVDEDDMTSNSATLVPTQQSVKAYVDSQVTAQDLDFAGDTGGALSIDLDSESLTIAGGTGIDTSGATNTLTVAIDSTVTTLTGTQTLTNKTLTSPTVSGLTLSDSSIIFEGATADDFETTLTVTDPTADRTLTLPNATDTLVGRATTDTLTNKTISGSSNTLSNIANSSLTNSTVSYGGVSVALGASDATPAFDLSDATAYPGDSSLVTTGALNSGSITSGFGSIDVGASAITTTGTVTGGTLAGTLSTAAQTNITSVGTLSSATISGDLTVDTSTLKVDSTNNRVGIGNASPDVSLDLGSNTDSIHVPVGTTAQRPTSPAAGYFRYNTTTSGFEGYTDSWGSIGGGGTAPVLNTMTGDGSDTTLTLTSAPVNENATVVTIDGVVQHKDTYSISGTTLTFSEAPPNGSAVECVTWVNTTVSSALLLEDADADTKVQVEESSDEDKIRFDTGGTERMIIDSTGVGIGTSSPSATLDIESSLPIIHLEDNVGSTARIYNDNGVLGFDADHNQGVVGSAMTFSVDASEAMRITSGGNVGIGTSSPSDVLHVKKTSGGLNARIESADSNAAGHLYQNITTGTTTGDGLFVGIGSGEQGYFYHYENKPLIFGINNSEKMRLDEAGDLGIGTTNPTAPLTVNTGSDGNNVYIDNNGTQLAIGSTSSVNYINTQNGSATLAIQTNGTERMRIESSAMVKLAPSINIGSLRNNGVSVGTSATNVLNMGSLVTSGDIAKGRYLVTICAAGGTVGTAATGIFGLASSGAVYLYETVNSDSITLGTSGSNVTAQTSSGTYTMHVNAIPLSVDN